MQNIRPSAELRNKYNEISNLCKETREPVYITVNGHGDTVRPAKSRRRYSLHKPPATPLPAASANISSP